MKVDIKYIYNVPVLWTIFQTSIYTLVVAFYCLERKRRPLLFNFISARVLICSSSLCVVHDAVTTVLMPTDTGTYLHLSVKISLQFINNGSLSSIYNFLCNHRTFCYIWFLVTRLPAFGMSKYLLICPRLSTVLIISTFSVKHTKVTSKTINTSIE